jgi:hypothetical protein
MRIFIILISCFLLSACGENTQAQNNKNIIGVKKADYDAIDQFADLWYQFDNTYEDVTLNFYDKKSGKVTSLENIYSYNLPRVNEENGVLYAYQISYISYPEPDEAGTFELSKQNNSEKTNIEKILNENEIHKPDAIAFYRVGFGKNITKQFCLLRLKKYVNIDKLLMSTADRDRWAEDYLIENVVGKLDKYPKNLECEYFNSELTHPEQKT